MEDIIALGDKINLVGFKIFSGSEMIIIRKMIGNYVRKFMEKDKDFTMLTLHVKTIHEIEDNKRFEMKAAYEGTQTMHVDGSEKNVFVCLDNLLKKLDR